MSHNNLVKVLIICWLNILKRKDLKHPWIYIVFKNLNTSSKHCTEHNQGLLHLANDEQLVHDQKSVPTVTYIPTPSS